jgi:hypothetical protein
VIWDANRSVRFRVEITVRTLSHQWSSCKNGPAEKAGRDGTFCYCPHGGIPRQNGHPGAGTLTQRHGPPNRKSVRESIPVHLIDFGACCPSSGRLPSSTGNSTVPAIAPHCSFGTATMRPSVFRQFPRSELIAAFARLTPVGIKIGVAIHAIRLRLARSLSIVRLSGVRQGQHQTDRKAVNRAHDLFRQLGGTALRS